MKDKSVSIIGSGIGALFTGAILAKHGFKVNVYESLKKIGGYATSWSKNGYTFEVSLHEINGFGKNDTRKHLFEYLNLYDKLKFLRVPSCYTSVFDGYEFRVPENYEEFERKLKTEYPDEADGIEKVMRVIRKISDETNTFTSQKSKILSYLKAPFIIPTIIKYLHSTVYDLIWKNLKNPHLRSILGQLIYYYSDRADKLNAIYFATPTYTYINEGYWISGSSANMAKALAETITDNGGAIFTGAKVEKILFDDKNRAIGIKLASGEEIRSDITICNASIIDAFKSMIPENAVNPKIRKKALNTQPSNSIFTLYMGLDVDVKKIGITDYCYFLNGVDDIGNQNEFSDYNKNTLAMVSYFLDHSLAPEGKTTVTVCTVADYDYWNNLKRSNPDEYKKKKDEAAEIIINRINKRFPGFKESIKAIDIATPVTMERFSGNTNGAVYGASQLVSQSIIYRFPNALPKQSLYFTGAWTMPGGGFTGVVISAMNAAEAILKKNKIRCAYR